MSINLEEKTGLTLLITKAVTAEDTALHYGSGLVEVFATPALIAFMENAALHLVLPYLDEGYNTVGIEVNVKHLKATPVGMQVRCEATLEKVEGRKLTFSLAAWDEEAKIGEGTHVRFIINTSDFMNKLSGTKP
jgi:fluoroacetyl-CoA thioesterase